MSFFLIGFFLNHTSSIFSGTDPLKVPIAEITFEYLASNAWTNHVIFFEKIFEKIEIDTLLEFGIGNSTKYFLENADHVVSIELNAKCSSQQTEAWFHECCLKFQSTYSNWTPILYNCSKEMSDLTRNGWQGKNLRPSQRYFREIKMICKTGLEACPNQHSCTLAFVDSALFGRAYIVNELLKRHIPIVVAHDTDLGTHFYAWDHLKTSSDYMLIQFKEPLTNQLSVWVRKGLLSDNDLFTLQSQSNL